jgi:hypothetical protein
MHGHESHRRSATPYRALSLPFLHGRPDLTHSHIIGRRRLVALALVSPLALVGCGSSKDGTNVEIGDATKAEAKARAEMYRAKANAKKQSGSKR